MIEPGQSYTYEFTAPDVPEMGMYHPHNGGSISVINGVYGQFQVGDAPAARTARPSAASSSRTRSRSTKEMPMVLNDAGTIGLSLNGKSFPATDPVVANPGETLKVTYHNEGLHLSPDAPPPGEAAGGRQGGLGPRPALLRRHPHHLPG